MSKHAMSELMYAVASTLLMFGIFAFIFINI